MSQEVLILYHAACQDGWASAWSASFVHPDAEFVPVNYGEPPPDVAGRTVFVLDFSYKRDVLLAMAKSAKSVTLRDHHASAEKELADLPDVGNLDVLFDMKKSGAMLAWELFHPGKPPPWIVRVVQARDLWTWDYPNSRELSAYVRSFPFDFAVWNGMAWFKEDELVPCIDGGRAILRAESQVVYNHVKNATLVEIAGYKVPCVNATTLISEVVGKLAEGGYPFAAGYFDKPPIGTIYSFRSREGGIDVSEIAKVFQGGGHRNASGAQLPLGFRFPAATA